MGMFTDGMGNSAERAKERKRRSVIERERKRGRAQSSLRGPGQEATGNGAERVNERKRKGQRDGC